MRLRRLLQVAVVSTALVSPLVAFAATVTTAPLGQQAPALTMPLLVALALALIGIGAYSLRTRSVGVVAGLALVAGLSVLAGLCYANGGIFVQGPQCDVQTTQSYPNIEGETLTSLCPNQIQIVALECNDMHGSQAAVPPSSCTVGQTLSNGQVCTLPACFS